MFKIIFPNAEEACSFVEEFNKTVDLYGVIDVDRVNKILELSTNDDNLKDILRGWTEKCSMQNDSKVVKGIIKNVIELSLVDPKEL